MTRIWTRLAGTIGITLLAGCAATGGATPSASRTAAPAIESVLPTAASLAPSPSTMRTSHPATALPAGDRSLWPQGGPVPDQLDGDWFDAGGVKLTLHDTGYYFYAPPGIDVGGDIVFDGNKAALFNAGPCGIVLPDGIGTYTWEINPDQSLTFHHTNTDPCHRGDFISSPKWFRKP